MLITESITITETKKIVKIIMCDVCKKQHNIDTFEAQEFIKIRSQCGYGSIFGDGDSIHLDICQHCLKERIPEVRIIEEE